MLNSSLHRKLSNLCQCSAESPCDLCPRGRTWSKSNWEAVGCKRGELKTQMLPVRLCSHPGTVEQEPSDLTGIGDWRLEPYEAANSCLLTNSVRREEELNDLALTADQPQNREPGVILFASNGPRPRLDVHFLPLGLPVTLYSRLRTPDASSPALVPLSECILAIAWELHDRLSTSTLLVDGRMGLIKLLRASAIYQARFDKVGLVMVEYSLVLAEPCFQDQLIAQSLICFRSCLEALRIKELGLLKRTTHLACDNQGCKVQCLANLDLHLTLYLDELSRVFFKKENLRDKNKTDWFVSTFYSFCIQAFVRRALQKLSTYSHGASEAMENFFGFHIPSFVKPALAASNSYLHLAIHLFIASNGSYDPLTVDYSKVDEASPSEFQKDVTTLRQTLGAAMTSSSEYLKKIYEITENAQPASPGGMAPGLDPPLGISGLDRATKSHNGQQEWDWLTMSL